MAAASPTHALCHLSPNHPGGRMAFLMVHRPARSKYRAIINTLLPGPGARRGHQNPLSEVHRPAITYPRGPKLRLSRRSEEHTSELQSLMRISYAVFCLTQKKDRNIKHQNAKK